MRTLVLGLGNPILTDDGVGIHVVRAVASRCSPGNDLAFAEASVGNDLAFAEASVGGLRLLDLLVGYERVILVDAIQTRGSQPGEIHRLGLRQLPACLHSGSTHDLSLPAALELGRRLGMKLPRDEDLTILAVEVEDVLSFGESCTPAVAKAILPAAEATLGALQE